MLTDISIYQDRGICVLNFVPSVDNFWVLGNTIYKDYYVYHNPERSVMGWVPTSAKRKTELISGPRPTTIMEPDGYKWSAFFKKIAIALVSAGLTAATA